MFILQHMCNLVFLLLVPIDKIKFFNVLSKKLAMEKFMQFCQIGGGGTGPKKSRNFSGQFLVIHSVRHILGHIYANF
jgi:hypothetical protein